MNIPLIRLIACAGLVLAGPTITAAGDAPPATRPAEVFLRARPKDLEWFRDAKFGMMVCWGPVSLKGTEIGWSRRGERRGDAIGDWRKAPIPVDEYDNLYKQFNPTEFDAKEWVAVAKAAGMKYLVFLTRHHDGFSMFDTRLSDYKITNTPFKRDVTAEVAQACHETGIKLGFYYSQPDWHHPDYRTENHARYIQYLHGQLRELCTRYGKVDIIWFDGLHCVAEDWDAENLFKMIRRLQPGVLINNRAGLPGDFDTPEQKIGNFQTDRPWETCMTLGLQWSWKPDEQLKSLSECIQTLVKCVGGDGNFLLNAGPMPSGPIEPRQVAIYEAMGEWLSKYGQSIYGTRGGPFRPGSWGVSTHKGDTIYVHILNWAGERLTLPAIKPRIVASSVLTGGTAEVKQIEQRITISIPPSERQETDTIVVLKLDGPITEICASEPE